MLTKLWNKRIAGIPHVFIMLIGILRTKMLDKMSSIFVKLNLAEYGKNVIINRSFTYRYPSKIFIKNNVNIGMKVVVFTELPNNNSNLIIEDGVSIGQECRIDFTGGITLCKNSHLAPFVSILTHDHGYDYRNTPIGKPLIIGENAFVGSRAQILQNVNKIGRNAVIGCGSIVTKDVPENVIVAGNPARIIKYI